MQWLLQLPELQPPTYEILTRRHYLNLVKRKYFLTAPTTKRSNYYQQRTAVTTSTRYVEATYFSLLVKGYI